MWTGSKFCIIAHHILPHLPGLHPDTLSAWKSGVTTQPWTHVCLTFGQSSQEGSRIRTGPHWPSWPLTFYPGYPCLSHNQPCPRPLLSAPRSSLVLVVDCILVAAVTIQTTEQMSILYVQQTCSGTKGGHGGIDSLLPLKTKVSTLWPHLPRTLCLDHSGNFGRVIVR
jgi:hypothetical protein